LSISVKKKFFKTIFYFICPPQMVKGIVVGSTKVAESVVPAGEGSSPASPGGEAQEALAALPAWVWVLVALGLLALFPLFCCIRAWWRNNKVQL